MVERVPAEDGEREIVGGTEVTKAIDGIEVIEVVEEAREAIFTGPDPDCVNSSSKESIAGTVKTVSIPTIYRTATNTPVENWQIHRSNKGRGKTTIRGRSSDRKSVV